MHEAIKNSRDLVILLNRDYEKSPYTRIRSTLAKWSHFHAVVWLGVAAELAAAVSQHAQELWVVPRSNVEI